MVNSKTVMYMLALHSYNNIPFHQETFTCIHHPLAKQVRDVIEPSPEYRVHAKKMAETHCVPCCVQETWVSLGLFSDVSNASWLRGEATGGRLEAALLDPSMVSQLVLFLHLIISMHSLQIVSSFHVLASVNKALVSRDQDQMKTKSIFSEIIFSLSPSTNVRT